MCNMLTSGSCPALLNSDKSKIPIFVIHITKIFFRILNQRNEQDIKHQIYLTLTADHKTLNYLTGLKI